MTKAEAILARDQIKYYNHIKWAWITCLQGTEEWFVDVSLTNGKFSIIYDKDVKVIFNVKIKNKYLKALHTL